LAEYTSPNWNRRPAGAEIDTVILHYTGMKTGEEALQRLCDPAAEVSAHYLIEEDGRLFQLVAEENRAWHAGVSHWQGRENLNHTSIGIELVNPGHEFGYRPFPPTQIETLLCLLDAIKQQHKIPVSRFLGHSDIAPARKADPGHLFPWAALATEGFGVFSGKDGRDQTVMLQHGDSGPSAINLNKQLGIIGYHGCYCDNIEQSTVQALKAFQTHWRPGLVNGVLDKGTSWVLEDIVQKITA